MKELSKEELWDECALAFNIALEKASRAYHWRYERIHQAKKQIRHLIENQPEVDVEFIRKYVDKFGYYTFHYSFTILRKMLHEAGVKIKGGSNESVK